MTDLDIQHLGSRFMFKLQALLGEDGNFRFSTKVFYAACLLQVLFWDLLSSITPAPGCQQSQRHRVLSCMVAEGQGAETKANTNLH